MKATIVFVILSTAVTVIFANSLFNEKDEAKTAISTRYKEAEDLITKIDNDISKEMNNRNENSESQLKATLEKKNNEALVQFEKNVKETTRTAIAKGKPIQAIDCIGTTSIEGRKIISDTNTISKNAIDNVLKNKLQKLEFLKLQNKLITDALADLKKQNLDKIDSIKDGYEAVKADAFRKVDSAKKQLHEIENRVTKPLLSDEYSNIRKQIESKYKDILDNLLKKLQKCIN